MIDFGQTPATPHPLVALACSRGNGASDIRDAAHEAFHALSVGAKKNWDREALHARLIKRFKGADLWLQEMHARAVEQLVCRRFGFDPGTLEHWVTISCMEAVKFGLPHARPDVSLPIAAQALESKRVIAWADEIARLAP